MIDSKLVHPEKTESSIVFTLAGIYIDVRLLQPEKVFLYIV